MAEIKNRIESQFDDATRRGPQGQAGEKAIDGGHGHAPRMEGAARRRRAARLLRPGASAPAASPDRTVC